MENHGQQDKANKNRVVLGVGHGLKCICMENSGHLNSFIYENATVIRIEDTHELLNQASYI